MAGTFEKIDMVSEPGAPTLDQLKVFLTIVETGSFAAAARALNRATSVVSYEPRDRATKGEGARRRTQLWPFLSESSSRRSPLPASWAL